MIDKDKINEKIAKGRDGILDVLSEYDFPLLMSSMCASLACIYLAYEEQCKEANVKFMSKETFLNSLNGCFHEAIKIEAKGKK